MFFFLQHSFLLSQTGWVLESCILTCHESRETEYGNFCGWECFHCFPTWRLLPLGFSRQETLKPSHLFNQTSLNPHHTPLSSSIFSCFTPFSSFNTYNATHFKCRTPYRFPSSFLERANYGISQILTIVCKAESWIMQLLGR